MIRPRLDRAVYVQTVVQVPGRYLDVGMLSTRPREHTLGINTSTRVPITKLQQDSLATAQHKVPFADPATPTST